MLLKEMAEQAFGKRMKNVLRSFKEKEFKGCDGNATQWQLFQDKYKQWKRNFYCGIAIHLLMVLMAGIFI